MLGAGSGITELDLLLTIQPAPMMTPTVVAQDTSTGPNATIGGQGNCVKIASPAATPAKIVMRVRGQGLAAGQIYVK